MDSMIHWLLIPLAILPLVYTSATPEPLIPIRYLLLSSFTLAFVGYFFAYKRIPIRLNWAQETKWVFGLELFIGVWSIFSMSRASYPIEGFYPVARWCLHGILLFCIATAVSREPKQLYKLAYVMVLMGIVQGVVGIFQFYGLAFISIPGQAPPYGFMGNRNLFGSGQVLLLPFTLWCFFTQRGIWKYIAATALPILLFSILVSQTRSAWVGLFLFIILALILIISQKSQFGTIIQKYGTRITVAMAGLIALMIGLGIILPQGKIVRETMGRLINSPSELFTENTSANFRLIASRDCYHMMMDHPMLGVGPGNWRLLVSNYSLGDRANRRGYALRIRPHNDFGEIGAERGIPGLVAYLGIWVFLCLTAFKLLHFKQNLGDQLLLVLLIIAVFGAMWVDMLVSFPNERIEHSLYYLFFWGILLGLRQTEEKTPVQNTFSVSILALLITVPLFNLMLGVYKFKYEYHLTYANAYKKAALTNPFYWDKMIEHAKKAKSPFQRIGPVGDPITMYEAIGYKGKKQFDKALQAIELAAQEHPNSARVYSTMGTIYAEQKNYPKAIESYKRALEIAPAYQTAFKNLALCYYNTGDYANTVKALNKVDYLKDAFLHDLYKKAKAKLK